MNSSLIDKADEIQNLIRTINKNLRDYIMNVFKDYNITIPQMMLLKELYFNPDISLHELSEKLSLSNSTVSGIVDRLVKHNFITREIPENNRRSVRLNLSPDARKKAGKINEVKKLYLYDIIKNEDVEKIEKLADSLTYLNNLLIEKTHKENK